MRYLLFATLILFTGCAMLTEKAEEVTVDKLYPRVEKKVIKYVELALQRQIDLGVISESDLPASRKLIYGTLIQVRDDIRQDVFGIKRDTE